MDAHHLNGLVPNNVEVVAHSGTLPDSNTFQAQVIVAESDPAPGASVTIRSGRVGGSLSGDNVPGGIAGSWTLDLDGPAAPIFDVTPGLLTTLTVENNTQGSILAGAATPDAFTIPLIPLDPGESHTWITETQDSRAPKAIGAAGVLAGLGSTLISTRLE